MPDLNQIPVPEYSPDQPYHWEYDNLPLESLANRDLIINSEVNNLTEILLNTSGNQGTLSNRLNQSLSADGGLISSAVDESMHNIANHTDGITTVSNDELASYVALGFPSIANPVSFVRFLSSERSKLAGIAADATNMVINVETISNIISFEQGPITLATSNSIQWVITPSNVVQAVLAVSLDFAHRHYYDVVPVMVSGNQNYEVNSISSPFIEDSLRVYINGTRLNPIEDVYYPNSSVTGWNLNSFSAFATTGTFTLSNPISDSDIILIDFDISLT